MFFRRTAAVVAFGLLLLFGLFGLRQRALFTRGYDAGFAAAQQAAAQGAGETAVSAAEAGTAEAARPAPHAHGWGYFPFFGIVGLFFKFWLLLFLFGFTMRLLGFGRHRRWHHHRGRRGPWQHRHGRCGSAHATDEAAPYEKQPEDVEPDVRYV